MMCPARLNNIPNIAVVLFYLLSVCVNHNLFIFANYYLYISVIISYCNPSFRIYSINYYLSIYQSIYNKECS